jgi:MFS family permease
MVGTTLPTPMYALYADRMHFAVLTTTIIFAIYATGVLAALLSFGRWSDAIGRRPVLLAGAAFALISAVVFLFADSVPQLLVGRVLSGLSAGIYTGTATAAIIEAAPPAWRERAPAVATIANMGGLGAGPILAGVLVQYAPYPLHLTFVVHIGLVIISIFAVLTVPETSSRTGRIGLQRISVPEEVRGVFATASIAAFAGFAVTGLFGSVAPSFLAHVLSIENHALAGLTSGLVFMSSVVAQLFSTRIPPARAVAVGCAILIAGMVILVAALHFSSFAGLLAAAMVSGVGQGISFSRGLAAVAEHTPPDRRAEVNSTYYVVAYVALAVPVVGEGFASNAWGLRTGGIVFAVAVGLMAIGCLVALIWRARFAAEAN